MFFGNNSSPSGWDIGLGLAGAAINLGTSIYSNETNRKNQEKQLNYQKDLNTADIDNYNSRNNSIRQALQAAGYGKDNDYLKHYIYGNKDRTPMSMSEWEAANPDIIRHLDNAERISSLNGSKSDYIKRYYNDYLAEFNKENSGDTFFDTNDFITLYNMSQNEKLQSREDTAVSRALKDMESAGYSPLSFFSGGASSSVNSVGGTTNNYSQKRQAGSYTPFDMSFDPRLMEMASAAAQVRNTNAQTDVARATAEKIHHDIKEVDSRTLLNGSLLDLNSTQNELYQSQIKHYLSQINLNNIQKELFVEKITALQHDIELSKSYGLPVGQQIPVAISGMTHIIDGIGIDGAASAASAAFTIASLIPALGLGAAGARILIKAGARKYGKDFIRKYGDDLLRYANDLQKSGKPIAFPAKKINK